jgi:glucose/arabinose dehydrogenase
VIATLAAAAAFVLLAAGTGDADPRQDARVQLEEIGRFDKPVYVHQPPSGADGQLFVVEQPGRVKVMNLNGGGESQFLNIEGKVASGGERGLLSIAFAPDYAESGRFYVFYTATGGPAPGGPLDGAQAARHRAFALSQPQRRAAAVRARRVPLRRHR